MTVAVARQSAVDETMRRVRNLAGDEVADRATLAKILDELVALAGQRELWTDPQFAPPAEGERQARYLITEQPDQSFALYLNVMRPGKQILPHNHTTWACIAAAVGSERNDVFDRLDDGSKPGKAQLAHRETIMVGPGTGIALMPDDIHSVQIEGDQIIRHLHLYGMALETLDRRIRFDPEAGTCELMPIGVQTRR